MTTCPVRIGGVAFQNIKLRACDACMMNEGGEGEGGVCKSRCASDRDHCSCGCDKLHGEHVQSRAEETNQHESITNRPLAEIASQISTTGKP
jgi:hypothetical protein